MRKVIRFCLHRITALLASAALIATIIGVVSIGVPSVAAPPAGEFKADLCVGTTSIDDPEAAPGPVSDLTRVFGKRLEAYNEGRAVPLYDSFGGAIDAYPPLCAVYRDPLSGEPVSSWMFCTDITKKVCGGVDAAGNLLEEDAVVPPLADLAGNPRLSRNQERVIAYLLQHGHTFRGTGAYGWNYVTRAGLETTEERGALQTLVWCVSDPEAGAAPSEVARMKTCADNMDAEEQRRILAMVPVAPAMDLAMSAGTGASEVGKQSEITVTTNVFQQPITIATTGIAADLAVCGGPGELTGNTLTVAGTNPEQPQAVRLCLTPRAAGDLEVSVSATPLTPDHLRWAQSADPCQVFARFVDEEEPVAARISLSVGRAEPTLTTEASSTRATAGSQLFDTVRISGFVPGSDSIGTATLYGPVTTRSGAMCTRANKVATVRFVPRNGVVRTPRVKVTVPGHYTWVAAISADANNAAARHRCGLAVESTLVHKPRYSPPRVETGFAGGPRVAARPTRESVRFAGAAVDASVTAVGIRRGAMRIPDDVRTLGRLKNSASIDDLIGTTVIAGHVSDRRDRPGAMKRLDRARKGQVVTVRSGTATHRFRVVSVARHSRAKALPRRYFATTGAHRLVLISCTDKVTRADGSWHYANNLVVVAKPIR